VTLLFPDSDRHTPRHALIAADAPSSYRGNAPFTRLLGATRGLFPAHLSRDAGRYLCNYVYWQALRRVQDGRPLVQFVHIPPVRIGPRRPGKQRQPSFAELVRAAEAILVSLKASV
jgi:pyroglutamyl-peptidase